MINPKVNEIKDASGFSHAVRNWVSLQLARFDFGVCAFARVSVLLNILIMVKVYQIKLTPVVITVGMMLLAVGFWVVGYIQHEVLKIPQKMEDEVVSRSPTWQRLFEQLKRIERKLG